MLEAIYSVLFCAEQNQLRWIRYGSYYVEVLNNIDQLYPGMRQSMPISVQAQDRYPVRTSIDQRGEQSINRDAKTSGGIKNIAKDSGAVLKWCLNRAEQANNTRELFSMANVDHGSTTYKPLRPSQIIQSEKRVQLVIQTLQEEYINPFYDQLNKDSLLHLSSGVSVSDETSEEILQLPLKGSELYREFKDNRINSKNFDFHAALKRNGYKSFKNLTKPIKSTASKNLHIN